ncbi:T4SS efffector SepA family protein [Roseobacter sp. HKCCA0434]|uniref:T4SS efffector SepA family protein n=1 Tax=Roseobacter sp. HKCCA0434 TaxID=3079297 RepID=UPI002905A5D7|nr:hypothetical protein [Roseobacter sp. HKCCA0434]
MKTVQITTDAYDFLAARARPFASFAETLDEFLAQASEKAEDSGSDVLKYDNPRNLPSVTHTVLKEFKADGAYGGYVSWNHALEHLIELSAEKGVARDDIKSMLKLKFVDGQKSDNGYRYVPAAGISFQGVDARRALQAAVALAAHSDIDILYRFVWADSDKAAHPGRWGELHLQSEKLSQ